MIMNINICLIIRGLYVRGDREHHIRVMRGDADHQIRAMRSSKEHNIRVPYSILKHFIHLQMLDEEGVVKDSHSIKATLKTLKERFLKRYSRSSEDISPHMRVMRSDEEISPHVRVMRSVDDISPL